MDPLDERLYALYYFHVTHSEHSLLAHDLAAELHHVRYAVMSPEEIEKEPSKVIRKEYYRFWLSNLFVDSMLNWHQKHGTSVVMSRTKSTEQIEALTRLRAILSAIIEKLSWPDNWRELAAKAKVDYLRQQYFVHALLLDHIEREPPSDAASAGRPWLKKRYLNPAYRRLRLLAQNEVMRDGRSDILTNYWQKVIGRDDTLALAVIGRIEMRQLMLTEIEELFAAFVHGSEHEAKEIERELAIAEKTFDHYCVTGNLLWN